MFDLVSTSLFGTADSAMASVSTPEFLMCCAASIVLGAACAAIYMFRHNYSKNFVVTLALLPLIVQMVITLVNGNLGAGIAVMGVFNLVRFRSIPGSAKDIGSVFLAMAIGLATGMGFIGLAVLFTIIVAIVNVVYVCTPFGKPAEPGKRLCVSVPEDLEFDGMFDDVLGAYLEPRTRGNSHDEHGQPISARIRDSYAQARSREAHDRRNAHDERQSENHAWPRAYGEGGLVMTRKTTDSRCKEGSARTDFVGMLRGAGLLLAGCAATVLLFSVTGCSATDADEPSIASTAEVLEENASEKSVEYASFEEVAAAFDVSALNLEYSKRDMDASFDESSATKITLSGDSASVSGSGATAEGSTVTISTAGTYIVSGKLTDGSITVTTSENDKVQIVLNGVKIACFSGPAIDVRSADKCFITLAEGTQNSLSDGSAFTSEDANACIYATCDLTINGSGSLDVSGNYRHGVFSKDDLVVYGGTINVSAVEDGLNGQGFRENWRGRYFD